MQLTFIKICNLSISFPQEFAIIIKYEPVWIRACTRMIIPILRRKFIMACFLVPTTEAIIMTIAKHSAKSREASAELKAADAADISSEKTETVSIPFSRKLGWLTNMLWGGSALLAYEHIWHGEITAYFPFLTAAVNPSDRAAMLMEMGTVGVSMAALVTAVWGIMCAVTSVMEKTASEKETEAAHKEA
jgi:hypothetical protein